MNTKEIAKEYRLTYWAGIMRERTDGGLSIREYCRNAGFHENIYYYWQRKLREAARADFASEPTREANSLVPTGFTEIRVARQPMMPLPTANIQHQVGIEVSGIRITACSEYPSEKLAALLREAMRQC